MQNSVIDTSLPLRNAAADGEEDETDPIASIADITEELKSESGKENRIGRPRRQMHDYIVKQGAQGKYDACLAAINKAISPPLGIHRSALPETPRTWQEL